jgi:uncharacterized protein
VNAFPENSNPGEASEPRGAGAPARDNVELRALQSVSIPPAHSGTNQPLLSVFPPPPEIEAPRDPAWNAFDVIRLTVLTVVAFFIGFFAVVLIARLIYPHSSFGIVARLPLVEVVGQAVAYLLVFSYMYILVTRERHRPDFLNAMHWNWPSSPAIYVVVGIVLSFGLQILASHLPIPKNLPIDTFFSTPAEAWVLGIFSITLAPLMEELFFRGFLYPSLARGVGVTPAIFITAFAFALTHGQQLTCSWGPVRVILLVGVVLTMVRAYKDSVAASLVVHIAYNGTITAIMFVATDGFRHLEKLNQ